VNTQGVEKLFAMGQIYTQMFSDKKNESVKAYEQAEWPTSSRVEIERKDRSANFSLNRESVGR
jgi:hypothetical protein